MNQFNFMKLSIAYILVLCLMTNSSIILAQDSGFRWPDGKKMAVSLSFDDARRSHPTTGVEVFRRIGGKATFYVNPPAMLTHLDGWKALVADGHEIGNHTMYHPCTGNFNWTKDRALENYTLHRLRQEILEANSQIHAMLGVKPVSFAYTCGHTFVGRGIDQKSYVPLIAELFESGRGWMNEAYNDPQFTDFALLQGNNMDGADFEHDIMAMIHDAQKSGSWLLLAGHEIGENANQTVNISMLEKLVPYLDAHKDDIWFGTVAEIAKYIKMERKRVAEKLAESLTFCASFDSGTSADVAKGDKQIYTLPAFDKPDLGTSGLQAAEVTIAEDQGLHGHALEFKRKGRQSIYYKAFDNLTFDTKDCHGTISMWLSLNPEEDLAPGFTDPIQITDSGYDDAAFWVDFTKENPRSFRMGVFGDVNEWNPDKIGPDENPGFKDRVVTAVDRPFSRSSWTHVVISFEGINTSKGIASFYINGKWQGSREITESFTWNPEKAKIFLGLNFIGLIDEVAIFDKTFSHEDVKELYHLIGGVGAMMD